ncbi:monocarboxylate transporter 9 [Ixodes scapularis]
MTKRQSTDNKSRKLSSRKGGIDRCWSVAAFAFIMFFMESATMRTTGFFYVGIMKELGVDRGQASWPVNLMGSVNDFGGLVSGPLSQSFSTVPVLLAGTLIASGGVMASSFAPDITWMSLTLGVAHGFGLGMMITMLQVLISMYFKRYRGVANGIMFAGSTFSSFVFPRLLLFLTEIYNFRNCLLLLGAILMNMTAVGLLFREPKWAKKLPPERRMSFIPEAVVYNDESEFSAPQIDTSENDHKQSSLKVIAHQVTEVFKSIMFYVLLISWLVLCYDFDIFFSTIIDFAIDTGVPLSDAMSLIPYFSITDLIGRIVLPLLADRKYVRRSTLSLLNFLFLGAGMAVLPLVTSYASLLAVCLFISFFMGSAVTMHCVLMADHIGLERLAVAYSIMGALCGPALMGKAPFVGYFRDDIGSYDLMFWILGALSILVSSLWLLVLCFEERKKKKWELDIMHNIPCTHHM